jgi:6-phosphogluconolactonase (cycloisomerase 2 family)
MRKKAVLVGLLCASLAGWVSCGSSASHYVYATIPAANQVVAYREDPNSGILSPAYGSPYPGGYGAQYVVVHPSNSFLYVANSGENDVSLFTIDGSDGALTEVTPRTTAGTSPTLLAMDPSGSYLYVANAGSFNISVFSINATGGGLTPVAGSPFSTGISPLDMKLNPAGTSLYVGGAGFPGGVVAVFSVTAGVLSLQSVTDTGSTNPSAIAIDPKGSYLYTGNTSTQQTTGGSISIFTIASTGALTEVSGSPLGETFTNPDALLVDPSGQYLYVANEGSSNVAVYTLSSGFPTVQASSPFGTVAEPSFLAVDPSGKYLLVGSQSSSSIQVFELQQSTGNLFSVSTNKVGNTASSLAVID